MWRSMPTVNRARCPPSEPRSVDKKVGQKILRSRRHAVRLEVGHAMLREQLIVDEKVARGRLRVAREDQVGGVGQDLRRAAFRDVDPPGSSAMPRC